MEPQIINEIASQIDKETILSSLNVWTQLGLWLLGTALAAYAGSFFSKRGEHRAIRRDFTELKQQLKDTTEVVERVKTEISHQDWSTREWKSVRKLRTEEVVTVAHSFYKWALEEGQRAKKFAPLVAATMPIDEAITTCSLYLPELTPSIIDFTHKRSFLMACLLGIRKFNQHSFVDDHSRRSWDFKIEELRKAEIALLDSFLNLEIAAVQLMRELHGINTTSAPTT